MKNHINNILDWFATVFEIVIVDIKQFFRQKLVVISTLLTSVTMILSFGLGMKNSNVFAIGSGNYFDFIAPGIFAIGIMFSCTFSIGYCIIIDRQRRIIEDIILSPISYCAFLVGRMLGVMFKSMLQFLVLLIFSVLFFGLRIHHVFLLFITFLTSSIFFAGFGILIASFNNEVSFASISNLILIPLFYFSSVFFPIENFGNIQYVVKYLPLTLHVLLFRYSTNKMMHLEQIPLLILLTLIYAVTIMVMASAIFKWQIKNQ